MSIMHSVRRSGPGYGFRITFSLPSLLTLPDKQCTSDRMPTAGLFKQVVDALEPFLVELFNWSLNEGLVPSVFKA